MGVGMIPRPAWETDPAIIGKAILPSAFSIFSSFRQAMASPETFFHRPGDGFQHVLLEHHDPGSQAWLNAGRKFGLPTGGPLRRSRSRSRTLSFFARAGATETHSP